MSRLLMCPPDYYGIEYEINPWMRVSNQSNGDRARTQWQTLTRVLEQETGAKLEFMEPVSGLPDLVFTANAGSSMRARPSPVASAILNAAGKNAILLSGSPKRATKSSSLMPTYSLKARGIYWDFRNSGLAAIGNAAISACMTGYRPFSRKKFCPWNWWINGFIIWIPAFVR